MLLNNKFYRGTDLSENRREALKKFFNPYEYNFESNLRGKNIENTKIKSESHYDRSIHKK